MNYAPTKEIRFATVMYGGISLCIYMNGIAQELLSLVMATAPNSGGDQLLDAPDGTSQAVYQELAQAIADSTKEQVRFIVDIISGTSAGGINGIFLAKALARQQSMKNLTNLWIEEGDLQKLINDKESFLDLKKISKMGNAKSLLNGQRMYYKLLEAMLGMEVDQCVENSTWVDQLDLYVTATDLDGLALPIRLHAEDPLRESDKSDSEPIFETRYRSCFHFKYESAMAAREGTNDFKAENTPFLAFAARCTSSIVPAFEPMRLIDCQDSIRALLGTELGKYLQTAKGWPATNRDQWSPFYKDYWRNTNVFQANKVDREKAIETAKEAFIYRAFGDGGYLDNKPFSYSTSSLAKRRAEVPVDRYLIYVEPDPVDPDQKLNSRAEPPNVINHAIAALMLPGKETIREDIERVLDRNELLERVDRIQSVLTDLGSDSSEGLVDGFASQAYQRIRLADTFDRLTALIAEMISLEVDSPFGLAIRYLVRAWYADRDPVPFLASFDMGYVDRLQAYCFRQFTKIADKDEMRSKINALNIAFGTFAGSRRKIRSVLRKDQIPNSPLDQIKSALLAMQIKLKDLDQILAAGKQVKAAQRLSLGTTKQPVDDAYLAKASEILDAPLEEPQFGTRRSLFDKVFELAAAVLSQQAYIDSVAALDNGIVSRHDVQDCIALPLTYGSGVTESRTVDILRMSPREATSLTSDPKEQREKLAGVTLGHFGAFLDPIWRRNDIMWGRLDAAEILIKTLCPNKVKARDLIYRAQLAIARSPEFDPKNSDDSFQCEMVALIEEAYHAQ